MSKIFQELAYAETRLGPLSLRRRQMPSICEEDIYEITLAGAFLMSSLFTVVEIALADLGLAATAAAHPEVVVGGLGLGYTALAALKPERVRSVTVVDTLAEVIDWHRQGLVPLGSALTANPRCQFLHGDFFALAQSAEGFDPGTPGRQYDAVLLDIDHSPQNLLDAGHGGFYQSEGLTQLARHLRPGGVFALWSDDPPDTEFEARLRTTFSAIETHVVPFFNPIQDRDSASTVYVAKKNGT